jgi:hypothetical protein
MTNNYTGIVYLNELIAIKEEDGYKKVIANHDIVSGTLLLIEHVYSGSLNDCYLLIRDNEYFYNVLHPRTNSWEKEKNNNDNSEVSLEKTVYNCIGKNLDNVFIGDYMSKFNHACVPNSIFFSAISKKYNDLIVHYIAVCSTSNIKKDEEITIHYGFDRGHNSSDDFTCLCGKIKEERDNICDIMYKLNINLRKGYTEQIKILVNEYETKSKYIFVHQYAAKKGLISTNTNIISMTKSFVTYLNSMYKEGTIENKKEEFLDYVNQIFSFLDQLVD